MAEPSVAVDSMTNEVLAVDIRLKRCLQNPRKIHAVRPMKDGVIADFEIAEGMLKALIKRVNSEVYSDQRFLLLFHRYYGVEKGLSKIRLCMPVLRKFF